MEGPVESFRESSRAALSATREPFGFTLRFARFGDRVALVATSVATLPLAVPLTGYGDEFDEGKFVGVNSALGELREVETSGTLVGLVNELRDDTFNCHGISFRSERIFFALDYEYTRVRRESRRFLAIFS